MTVLLGGRAAERLIFANVSAGAQDDLQKASELARRMVTTFGMSEQLGPYALEQAPQPMFLPNGAPSPQAYSEATAHVIDQESQHLIERTAQRAEQLLELHRDPLEALAQYLLAHETIDQSTLALLLADLKLAKPPQPTLS